MSVYVHDNPQNLPFNAVMYAFMRQWYCPELEDHVFTGDTWFKVPAIKAETATSVSFTIINNKIELSSMMLISENSRLLRATRTRTDQLVPEAEMMRVRQVAFDIPAWELLHQKPFPYDKMFESALVNKRYKEINGNDSDAFFSIASADQLFTKIKTAVSPKPCNCGKQTYTG